MGFINRNGNLGYEVKSGDTLFGIAKKFKEEVPEIKGLKAAKVDKKTAVLDISDSFAKYNGLNPENLLIGSFIDIPDAKDYDEYNSKGETNIFLDPSPSQASTPTAQIQLANNITNEGGNLILTVPKGSNYWQIAGFILKKYSNDVPSNLNQNKLVEKLKRFNGDNLQAGSKINLSKFFNSLEAGNTSSSDTAANTRVENLDTCRYGKKTLKMEDSGPEVKNLQKDLRTLSWLRLDEDQLTNYFGPLTKEAVVKFQKARGLDPDGKVGPLTKEELIKALSEQSVKQ